MFDVFDYTNGNDYCTEHFVWRRAHRGILLESWRDGDVWEDQSRL
jgi:hypothetical protein